MKKPEKHVLLVGTDQDAGEVEEALRSLGAPVRRAQALDDLAAALSPRTAAVVIRRNRALEEMTRTCRAFAREKLLAVPVFAVLPRDAGRRSVARAYRSGVTVVFHWPDDRIDLLGHLLRVLSVPSLHRRDGRDRDLARSIRRRMRDDPVDYGHDCKVRVYGGVAYLLGTVPTLWRRHLAVQTAAEVPGVQDVIAGGLVVEESGRSDREVAASVRRVLRDAGEEEASTLAVRVTDGVVYLAGTVGDPYEMARLSALLSHIRGVRGIEDLTTLSPADKPRDAALARLLRDRIEEIRRPGDEIDVSAFGGIAVLSGTVDTLSAKFELERFARRCRGVRRVVNKLRVTGTLGPAP